MHHDASRDAFPTTLIKVTCKGQAWRGRKFMVACEGKEHGHDSKQRRQVEGPIMQAKEWMREFGWCNLWSTPAQKSQSGDHHTRGKPSQGRHETTQAGRPRPAGLPYKMHPSVLVFNRQATLPSLRFCARVFSPESP
jgi:hypothetical protein